MNRFQLLESSTHNNRNAVAIVVAFLVVIISVGCMAYRATVALKAALISRTQGDPIAEELYRK